jgi:hypothetical protein
MVLNQQRLLVESFISKASTQPPPPKKISRTLAHCSFQHGVKHTVLRDVLHNLLRLHAYEVQLRRAVKENYPLESVKYADLVLNEADEECFAK